MFSDDLKIHIPTDEEEAEIQREIAMDPDAPEWTDEDWARARPAVEVDPELVEYSLIRKTAQQYRDKGYDVSKEALLDFLPGFRADLLVRKDGISKVIEIKSWSSLAADRRIAKLADIIDSKPGWAFELIFVGEPGIRNSPAPKRYQIPRLIRRAEKEFDPDRPQAAFALAWSACAAAVREIIAIDGTPRPDISPAAYTLNHPGHLGAIANGQPLNLDNLPKYRNAIAHDGLTPEMVAELIQTARRMTAERDADSPWRLSGSGVEDVVEGVAEEVPAED